MRIAARTLPTGSRHGGAPLYLHTSILHTRRELPLSAFFGRYLERAAAPMTKNDKRFSVTGLIVSDVLAWTENDTEQFANVLGDERYNTAIMKPRTLSMTEGEYERFFRILGTKRLLNALSAMEPELRRRAAAWLEWTHREETLRLARSGRNAGWCAVWLAVLAIFL